ncbi:MAG: class I SAM-dependent methyltransferase [Anaerolineae bacterium]
MSDQPCSCSGEGPKVGEYFATVAEEWDELRAGYFDETVREAAIARAGLSPDMVVADVGTGTGFMALGLAPLVRRVYAIDTSAEMLKVLERKLQERGITNVELCQADGLALPLDDASVDAVFANMYLHHIPEPPLAIAEMVRVLASARSGDKRSRGSQLELAVSQSKRGRLSGLEPNTNYNGWAASACDLKPGGRLVLTDADEHHHEWMREEMADVWLGFDRGQIQRWFEEAGLLDVQVDCTGSDCCAESAEGEEAAVSIFVATGVKP